jgi:hypothetical protein
MTPEFLIALLRAARVRAQLAVLEIDSIGMAVKENLIDTETALAWLDDVHALRFLTPPDTEAAA